MRVFALDTRVFALDTRIFDLGTRIFVLETRINAAAIFLPGALASLLLGNPELHHKRGRRQSDKEGDEK